ncbi:MAG: hypothetical protein M0D53_11060 [Flavobacterium sp. JAD_PAG50586_2]|nr:MAG: hypothetical protein M0D53_11060 [Flavobacterium sp. JAD_PAG50586_2]
MKKVLIKYIVFCISISSIYCQNKTIKGRVIDERLEFMPMVSILNNQNVEVGKTDMNGFFQIEIPVFENKLSFRFTGLEPLAIELADRCDEVDVVMMVSDTYDFITLKKVDRLRKKDLRSCKNYIKKHLRKVFLKQIRLVIYKNLFHIVRKNKSDGMFQSGNVSKLVMTYTPSLNTM